jgi:hypothetical protein
MTLATRQPAGHRSAGCGALVRALAIGVLVSIALVPSLARAHDRVHRTPLDAHSRFRWANSCESVPQKVMPAAAAAAVERAALPSIAVSTPAWSRIPIDIVFAPSNPLLASPPPLRAPPSVV